MIFLRRHRLLVVALGLVVCLAAGGYSWYRNTYPYGRRHCCDLQIYFALVHYADTHGGNFPAGEATPEACLGLIQAGDDLDYSDLLCGKSGSASATRKAMEQGGLLGPETCGWNYVPGLRIDDDPRLALFWDKDGLGHHGERLDGGGYQVVFINCDRTQIRAERWNEFLAEQKILYKLRKNNRAKEKLDEKQDRSTKPKQSTNQSESHETSARHTLPYRSAGL